MERLGLVHHWLSLFMFPDGSGFWFSYNPQVLIFATVPRSFLKTIRPIPVR